LLITDHQIVGLNTLTDSPSLFAPEPRRAVRGMKADGVLPEDTKVRSSKYMDNLIEQDHRNIKSRTNAMVGFKNGLG
jgi:transposase-like protein